MKKSTKKALLWGGLAFVAYRLLKPKTVAVAAPQQTSNYIPTGGVLSSIGPIATPHNLDFYKKHQGGRRAALSGGGHHHHHGGGGGGGFWAGPSGVWGPWWDYPSTEIVYLAPTTCVDAKTKKPVPCP